MISKIHAKIFSPRAIRQPNLVSYTNNTSRDPHSHSLTPTALTSKLPHSMGACSSCLGFGRQARGDVEVCTLQTSQPPFLLTFAPLRVQNPETSRLLHDDPYRSQYGTDQSRRRAQDEPDPTEMTPQEREAQQRICHAMSEYVTYLRRFML